MKSVSPRLLGGLVLLLVLVQVGLGSELAMAGSPYPEGWLVAHVTTAFILVALAGYLLVLAIGRTTLTGQGIGALTFLGAIGATLAGFLFLFAGQSYDAFFAMEILGAVAALGGVLLLVFGLVLTPAPKPE